jgi:hypothetical protein
MKNTIEIKSINDFVETTIITTDSVKYWERHHSNITDEKVLEKIKDRNFYQKFKGEWIITFPYEYKMFTDAKFETAIYMALSYIHERNFPGYVQYI